MITKEQQDFKMVCSAIPAVLRFSLKERRCIECFLHESSMVTGMMTCGTVTCVLGRVFSKLDSYKRKFDQDNRRLTVTVYI